MLTPLLWINISSFAAGQGNGKEIAPANPSTEEKLLLLNKRVERLEEIIRQQQQIIEELRHQRKNEVEVTTSKLSDTKAQKSDTQEPSPLSLRIGSAYLTPLGFMDFTAFYRSTNTGSGIGTNFGG
jgi:TolA-binding protein